jgi:hypothetical protein
MLSNKESKCFPIRKANQFQYGKHLNSNKESNSIPVRKAFVQKHENIFQKKDGFT